MILREQIRDLWETVLEKDDFSDSDNIMECGATSLQIYKLSRLAAKKYDLAISPMDIMMNPTVDHLVDFMENGTRTSAERPRARRRRAVSKVNV